MKKKKTSCEVHSAFVEQLKRKRGLKGKLYCVNTYTTNMRGECVVRICF